MVKIIIADDDPDIVEVLQYNLSNEGFDVHAVNNGLEVLPLAKEINPELVILDIMMPGKDGVEVCEQLRASKQFENTIIIFITARSEDFTQIACYEHGGDDFIVKPVKPKVLISRIKAMLRRTKIASRGTSLIEFGDLVIDLEKFKVKNKGVEVQLAKKEYELLTLLASKPGKLFTREEIFNKVWGVELMIGDRTIDVHIRKLREKIGNDTIKTVKGVGYKINDSDI